MGLGGERIIAGHFRIQLDRHPRGHQKAPPRASSKPSWLSLRRAQAAYNPGRDGGVRMRLRHAVAIASFLIGSLAAWFVIAAVQDSPPSAESLARETLGPTDGWASFSGGFFFNDTATT